MKTMSRRAFLTCMGAASLTLAGCNNAKETGGETTSSTSKKTGGSSSSSKGVVFTMDPVINYDSESQECIFVTKVLNKSDKCIEQVMVSPIAKDADGNLTGMKTTSSEATYNNLQPNEEVYLVGNLCQCETEPVSIKLNLKEFNPTKPNSENEYRPKAGKPQVFYDDGTFPETRAVVELENDSDTDYSFVEVYFAFKDSSGNVIGGAAGGEVNFDSGCDIQIDSSTIHPREVMDVADIEMSISLQS